MTCASRISSCLIKKSNSKHLRISRCQFKRIKFIVILSCVHLRALEVSRRIGFWFALKSEFGALRLPQVLFSLSPRCCLLLSGRANTNRIQIYLRFFLPTTMTFSLSTLRTNAVEWEVLAFHCQRPPLSALFPVYLIRFRLRVNLLLKKKKKEKKKRSHTWMHIWRFSPRRVYPPI